MKKGSSSKSTLNEELPMPPPLNSFEAALAKKGISLETALEKATGSSPRKEQYLADLNGHRLL
jgi:hypothetical protein